MVEITVTDACRNYDYTAHVDRKTRRLKNITAGCRTWRTFKDAFQHYWGRGKYRPMKWTRQYMVSNGRFDIARVESRLAAVQALIKLQGQVALYQATGKRIADLDVAL